MRHPRSKAAILNKTNVPVPGEHYGVPTKPYVWRGHEKPETYSLDGETHRFDGTCHTDCEDVR